MLIRRISQIRTPFPVNQKKKMIKIKEDAKSYVAHLTGKKPSRNLLQPKMLHLCEKASETSAVKFNVRCWRCQLIFWFFIRHVILLLFLCRSCSFLFFLFNTFLYFVFFFFMSLHFICFHLLFFSFLLLSLCHFTSIWWFFLMSFSAFFPSIHIQFLFIHISL